MQRSILDGDDFSAIGTTRDTSERRDAAKAIKLFVAAILFLSAGVLLTIHFNIFGGEPAVAAERVTPERAREREARSQGDERERRRLIEEGAISENGA